MFSLLYITYVYKLQQSDDGKVDFSHCVDEMFHHTVNASLLRAESVHRSSTAYRRSADDVAVDDDTDEVVYVSDIADTNLLLVVVDGRRSVHTSMTTSHRQVVPNVLYPGHTTLKKRIQETCTSRLEQEHCTSGMLSCARFFSRTSFLHRIKGSSIQRNFVQQLVRTCITLGLKKRASFWYKFL